MSLFNAHYDTRCGPRLPCRERQAGGGSPAPGQDAVGHRRLVRRKAAHPAASAGGPRPWRGARTTAFRPGGGSRRGRAEKMRSHEPGRRIEATARGFDRTLAGGEQLLGASDRTSCQPDRQPPRSSAHRGLLADALRDAVPRRMTSPGPSSDPQGAPAQDRRPRRGEGIRIHFASACPDAALFRLLVGRLAAAETAGAPWFSTPNPDTTNLTRRRKARTPTHARICHR